MDDKLEIRITYKNRTVNKERIRNREQLKKLNLSRLEKKFVNSTNKKEYYFYNGINILKNSKHSKYIYRIYYIAGLSETYTNYIEIQWRINFGQPRLCSYLKGR